MRIELEIPDKETADELERILGQSRLFLRPIGTDVYFVDTVPKHLEYEPLPSVFPEGSTQWFLDQSAAIGIKIELARARCAAVNARSKLKEGK